MTEEEKQPKKWCYIGVPFRPVNGTYQTFDYEKLPTIDTKPFQHVKTLVDVTKHEEALKKQLGDSPTACQFSEIHENSD